MLHSANKVPYEQEPCTVRKGTAADGSLEKALHDAHVEKVQFWVVGSFRFRVKGLGFRV